MSRSNYSYSGANPFDDRAAAPALNYSDGQAPYPRSPPGYGGGGGAQGYGQNVEMASLAQNGSAYGQQQSNSNTLFREVDEISKDIDEVEGQLRLLKEKQKQLLLDTGRNAAQDLEAMNGQIMSELRTLTGQLRKMKSIHGNTQVQIKRIERRLKDVSGQYQNIESDFRRALRENMERQYRIVRPDATPEEVEQHIENPDTQVFAQALMQGNRMGNAQSVRQAVTARHEAIQKIESQMIELSQLFQQMNELVEEQEVAVANIEQKAEEVVEDMDKGNEQIDVAIKSAKSRNRKKWWCLGISILIIIVIVVIILIVKFVNGGFSSKSSSSTTTSKRTVLNLEELPVVAGGYVPQSKLVVPGVSFAESKAMVPGAGFKGDKVTPGVAFTESKPINVGAGFKETEKRDGGKFQLPSNAVEIGASFKENEKRDGGKFKIGSSKAVNPGEKFQESGKRDGGKFKIGSTKREAAGGKFKLPSNAVEIGASFKETEKRDGGKFQLPSNAVEIGASFKETEKRDGGKFQLPSNAVEIGAEFQETEKRAGGKFKIGSSKAVNPGEKFQESGKRDGGKFKIGSNKREADGGKFKIPFSSKREAAGGKFKIPSRRVEFKPPQ